MTRTARSLNIGDMSAVIAFPDGAPHGGISLGAQDIRSDHTAISKVWTTPVVVIPMLNSTPVSKICGVRLTLLVLIG